MIDPPKQMNNSLPVLEKFTAFKVCVIVPVYNSVGNLAQLFTNVIAYTDHVIVVNNGSTEDTAEVMSDFPTIKSLVYTDHLGKGSAIRKGFEHAVKLGFDYAITVDQEAQCFAHDIPMLIEKLETERSAIIVGSRYMELTNKPHKKTFGLKLSNFWFWVQTSLRCTDTKSGFRLYPLQLIKSYSFFTRHSGFETEVLVHAAWKNLKITSVPVTPDPSTDETKASGTNSLKRAMQMFTLNTVLLTITFIYIKPRNFFRILFSREKMKKVIKDQLFNPNHTPAMKAASIGFGVFMGIIPIWGFQLITAIGLAIVFKLNKALVVLAAHITMPPVIPLIIFLSYKTGVYWMGDRYVEMPFSANISFKTIGEHLEQYIYGSITLAVVAGLGAGLLTFALLMIFKKRKSIIT